MALSYKRQAFVEEYLRCFNASEAARRAGYRGKPNVVGPRLLANVSIKGEISRRLTEKVMTADEALTRLSDQARFDPGPYVYRKTTEEEGETDELRIDWESLKAAHLSHLVKAIYQTKYGTRLEFHDPQRALELIGKHHGLFADDKTITLKIEQEIEGILDRLEDTLSPDEFKRALIALSDEPAGDETAEGDTDT